MRKPLTWGSHLTIIISLQCLSFFHIFFPPATHHCILCYTTNSPRALTFLFLLFLFFTRPKRAQHLPWQASMSFSCSFMPASVYSSSSLSAGGPPRSRLSLSKS